MSIRSKIIRDVFTEKVLEVYIELIRKDALGKKGDFTSAVLMTLTEFYQLERQLRNYPKDEIKRSQARANLLDKYGINPSFLSGVSKTIFSREPEMAVKVSGSGAAKKITSARELEEYKSTIKIQEEEIADLKLKLSLCKSEVEKLKIKPTKQKQK